MNFLYTYLRLSLTDRCNFRCSYCRPMDAPVCLGRDQLLGPDEIAVLVKILVARGIRHVRLTGGEPLLREELPFLVKELSRLAGLEILSLTTNGSRLASMAPVLKESGLARINVSLNTLRKDRFQKLTATEHLNDVLEGIRCAAACGFERLKLNVVIMKGFNDDEIFDFLDFAFSVGADIRFIECFRTQGCETAPVLLVPSAVLKKKIEAAYGQMQFLGSDRYCGPAQYWRLKKRDGRIGFISSVSDFFCPWCNRLRLSCDGKLYPCLHSDYHVDLKDGFRTGAQISLVENSIESVLGNKKFFSRFFCNRSVEMSRIGG